MSEENVQIAREGAVATLTMNRPERHNAFDERLIETLTEAFNALGADGGVRAIVLAGAGRSFSAGADLSWMERMAGYGREENLADARALAELMRVIDSCPKPTLARVHGPAMGGGVGLVACCDIAIAGEAARFALSEVRLGLAPSTISPYVVRAIGARAARRYFVTGERFEAGEAHRLGLVHEVVANEALDARIGELCDIIAANGQHAMAESKALVGMVERAPLDAQMIERTARHIADIRVGEEGREGIAAFLGKRKPAWAES